MVINNDVNEGASAMAPVGPTQSEKAKIEQIVSEFYAKALHILLEARVPHLFAQGSSALAPGYGATEDSQMFVPGSPSAVARGVTNKWFNLEMESSASVQESVDVWRRGICQEPLVVDILLQQPNGGAMENSDRQRFFNKWSSSSPQRVTNLRGESWNDGNDGESFSSGGVSRTLLERWTVHYERTTMKKSSGLGFGGKQVSGEGGGSVDDESLSLGRHQQGGGSSVGTASNHALERAVVYKRTVIMLRSLYCLVRTLPAYRLFKLANSSSHSRSFSLSYTVSPAPASLSEQDERAMMTCSLTPIETQWGRLCISSQYKNATAVTALEVTPRILSRIIPDYVGSPTTDPMRRFPGVGSLPDGGISGRRDVHVLSIPTGGSVPSSPLRRHSWSGGVHKVQPQPPMPTGSPSYKSSSPSPSHPYLDFQNSPPKPPSLVHHSFSPSGAHAPSHLSPRNSPLQRQQFGKQAQPDSQPIPIVARRSPPFSPSPSPSPPQHGYSQPRSAPVTIPGHATMNHATMNRAMPTTRVAPEAHHHSRSPLPPPSPQTRPELSRAHSFNSPLHPGSGGPTPNLSLGSKIGTQLSTSDSSGHVSSPQRFRHRQVPGEEHERSPFSPPRLGGFRQHSSRVTAHSYEDPDTENFACPFALEYDEADDLYGRVESPGARPKVPDSPDFLGTTPGSQGRFQDAKVGELVRLLRQAAPLRQQSAPPAVLLDLPVSRMSVASSPTSVSAKIKISPPMPLSPGARKGLREKSADFRATSLGRSSGAGSSFGTSVGVGSPPSVGVRQASTKTAADALDELRVYREMRDFLVRQSGVNSGPGQPLSKPM